MQHANLAHGNTIVNKVQIDLDVLGALVLDGVRQHVDSANIVAEHNRSWRRWSMKLVEELTNPSSLSNDIGHITVLSLSAGTRDRVLPLQSP
jgi:hypothetical protein